MIVSPNLICWTQITKLQKATLLTQDSVPLFLECVRGGWNPDPDVVGASAKELLMMMSWVSRKNAQELVLEAHMDIEPCLQLSKPKCSKETFAIWTNLYQVGKSINIQCARFPTTS